jgi:hypothetical protein
MVDDIAFTIPCVCAGGDSAAVAWLLGGTPERPSGGPAEAVRILDLLNGPQRVLSREEIEREVWRLLALCARQGVGAVYREACSCHELLRSLAAACHAAGLASAGQYLDYLASPWL